MTDHAGIDIDQMNDQPPFFLSLCFYGCLSEPLGGSDELTEQYGDVLRSAIREEPVISRGSAPDLLELIEEPRDEIALFVERLVVGRGTRH
jgi:hypothetical protein